MIRQPITEATLDEYVSKRGEPIRYLIVTPEFGFTLLGAQAGGLGAVLPVEYATLKKDPRFDVHVITPLYSESLKGKLSAREQRDWVRHHSEKENIHFVNSSAWSRARPYGADPIGLRRPEDIGLALSSIASHELALAEKPFDIVHGHDWTTGLLMAQVKALREKGGTNAASLFTLHDIATKSTSAKRIDAADFDVRELWPHFVFREMPCDINSSGFAWHARNNLINLLATGIKNADVVYTVSNGFKQEILEDRVQGGMNRHVRSEVWAKENVGRMYGRLNPADDELTPFGNGSSRDVKIPVFDSPNDIVRSKKMIKNALQIDQALDLRPDAPLFVYTGRINDHHKGTVPIAQVIPGIVEQYKGQVVILGDGEPDEVNPFKRLAEKYFGSVKYLSFAKNKDIENYLMAGGDFTLMPSRREPGGRQPLEYPKFANLCIAHHVGGMLTTVSELDYQNSVGNGFPFKHCNGEGLWYGITEAMKFYAQPDYLKNREYLRIITEHQARFGGTAAYNNLVSLVWAAMTGRPAELN